MCRFNLILRIFGHYNFVGCIQARALQLGKLIEDEE